MSTAGREESQVQSPPPPQSRGSGDGPPAGTEARGLTRRDLITALLGVGAGAAGAVATGYVTDRVSPSLASTEIGVFAEIQWEDPWDGWTFYSDAPIDLSAQPREFESPEQQIDYLVQRGCVKASPLIIKVHLSRPGNSPAAIIDFDIVDHARMPAVNGARYLSETAGSNDSTVLGVNLDAQRPRLVRTNYEDMTEPVKLEDLPPAFAATTLTIEPHLTESAVVAVNTTQGAHEFALQVKYLVEGRESTQRIDAAGTPFRVTQHSSDTPARYAIPWYDGIHRFELQS